VGQALSAALKTVSPEKLVHSLHSYFLMKGDAKRNIIYQVQNLRDGKSFASRLVTASQGGSSIFVMIASFQVPHPQSQPVINHQVSVPTEVALPEELPTMEEYYANLLADPRCPEPWKPFLAMRTKGGNSPIDARPALTADFFAKFGPPPANRPKYPKFSDTPRQAIWMRCKKPLPDDWTAHAAVVAYASDMNLLGTAKHDVSIMDVAVIASLDHSMWFHNPQQLRADQWLLYALESPRATDGRGLAYGGIFTRDGLLVVTVAQEGVIRIKSKV
jgi:acyl-CoA thioesterase II